MTEPVLGPVVADVFVRYADGEPASQLCRRLSAARGLPTRIQQVKRLLTNPFYVGKVAMWGGRTRSSTTKPTLVVAGGHPPLVDEKTWERVQDRVRRESFTPKRLLAVSHELVSLVYCATCQQRAQRHETTEYGVRVVRLRCGQHIAKAGCPGCGAPKLEAVIEVVLARLGQRIRAIREDQTAALLVDAERARAGGDVEALKREIAETRRASAKVTDGWARGTVTDDIYQTLTARYAEQETELQGRIDDLERVRSRPAPKAYATLVEKLLTMWPTMSPEQRNRALKDVIRRVVIRRSQRWREPVDGLVAVEFE